MTVPTAGTVTFSGSGTTLRAYLGPVTVTDTRHSSLGWTVFGQASDSGGTLPGNALGWTPTVTSSTARVTLGGQVPPNRPGLGRAARLGLSAGDNIATLGATLILAVPAGQAVSTRGLTITITVTPAAV